VIEERRRGGSYRSISDLAGRSGAGAAALQRLAWAGACDSLVGTSAPADPDVDLRRPALWDVGGAARAVRDDDGAQLALALDGSATPPLPALGPWERIVADYRTTGMTLGRHPMELLRQSLPSEVLTSEDLARTADGARVRIAGMVVARQRPATANGVVFMLLEDERGTINLILPPPVVERCRLAVRTSGFVQAVGKLEHREGTTNVVVSSIERLEPADSPPSPDGLRFRAPSHPREIEPPVHRETGREPERSGQPGLASVSAVGLSKRGFDGVREAAMAELAASLPAPHSFGRRGR
jgi:error-prone DNA polymerase